MSRISFSTHPYLLGFEQLDQLVERTAKNGMAGYPPFNIEQYDEDTYRITLAIAGFSESDLNITQEGGELRISGQMARADDARVFLHRGIAERQFQRTFVLAQHIDVREARLEQGLLKIDLIRRRPDVMAQTVRINSVGEHKE